MNNIEEQKRNKLFEYLKDLSYEPFVDNHKFMWRGKDGYSISVYPSGNRFVVATACETGETVEGHFTAYQLMNPNTAINAVITRKYRRGEPRASQGLFDAILAVTGHHALESEMHTIIRAIERSKHG